MIDLHITLLVSPTTTFSYVITPKSKIFPICLHKLVHYEIMVICVVVVGILFLNGDLQTSSLPLNTYCFSLCPKWTAGSRREENSQ